MGTDVKKLRREVRELKTNQNLPQSKVVAMAEYRSGILPPPEEMERYEQLVPGLTDRLVKTYEKQVQHRIEIEKTVIEGDSKRANRGQNYSFIIVMAIICIAFYLMINGYNIAGLGSLLVGIGSLISIFIGTSRNRSEERKNKREKQ